METKKCIRTRRSIRGYKNDRIGREVIERLVEDASWAPSGLNKQPWKFMIVDDAEKIKTIASISLSQSEWIQTAPYLLLVFFDKSKSYNEERDLMAIGAAIQNFMLSAHDENIGTCWLGGILSDKAKILSTVNVSDDSLNLVAVITAGRPNMDRESTRVPLSDILLS